MPSLAALHPQVVHFVVALIVVGVAVPVRCRCVVRRPWLSPAAAALVALGTVASVVAVRSGDDAHGPVERVPGARAAVVDHETWGERARNVFLILLVVEAVAAALAVAPASSAPGRPRWPPPSSAWSPSASRRAVGELGGELVYGYAGGVGIRSGDPADVNRLLIAAAHHQAALDRQSGSPPTPRRSPTWWPTRFPDHLELQLAQVESIIVDRKAPAASQLDQSRRPPRLHGCACRASHARRARRRRAASRRHACAARQVRATNRVRRARTSRAAPTLGSGRCAGQPPHASGRPAS